MVSIKEVAADAGVARSTVSYVLSGNKKLPETTREKVLASVAKLGYRPDPLARALALRRTNILGLLASIDTQSREADIDVFMRFVRAAMYEARARGFDLLVMGKGEEELRGDILADALVVMDIRRDDPRIPVLSNIGLPTVLIGYPGDDSSFSSVDLDFEQAGRTAVQHLADLGHTQIAVLGPVPEAYDDEMNFALRFREGFEAECRERGVLGLVLPCGEGADDVAVWLETVRESLPELSAIVNHHPGALEAFTATLDGLDVRIPEDCSIVAIAPESLMRHSDHPLTVIDLPGEAMVGRAVALALDELAGDGKAGLVEFLPAVLQDFGSTARHVAGVDGTVFAPSGSRGR